MDTTNIENAVPVPEQTVEYKVSSSGEEQPAQMVVSTTKDEDTPQIIAPSGETPATMVEESADETAGTSSDGAARHATVVDDDVILNNNVTVAGDARFHRVFAGSCNLINELRGDVDNVKEGIDEVKEDGKKILKSVNNIRDESKSRLEDLDRRKVDKLDGYGLSQNDFTDELLEKLNDIGDNIIPNLSDDSNTKLPREEFDALFERVNIGTEENPRYAIRAKMGLFSDEFVSAMGSNASASGGSGGFDLLQEWNKYDERTAKQEALSAQLGKDLDERLTAMKLNIADDYDIYQIFH